METADLLTIAARIHRVADIIERDAKQDGTRSRAQEVAALADMLERWIEGRAHE